MARQKKVVDASVIVKWFSIEEGSQEAEALLDEHSTEQTTLIIPELALLETMNTLRFKKIDADTLKEVHRRLWKIQLHIEQLNQFLMEKIIQLSLQYNLTLYDATYLAIAQTYGCPLITADKKLAATPNSIHLTDSK